MGFGFTNQKSVSQCVCEADNSERTRLSRSIHKCELIGRFSRLAGGHRNCTVRTVAVKQNDASTLLHVKVLYLTSLNVLLQT